MNIFDATHGEIFQELATEATSADHENLCDVRNFLEKVLIVNVFIAVLNEVALSSINLIKVGKFFTITYVFL